MSLYAEAAMIVSSFSMTSSIARKYEKKSGAISKSSSSMVTQSAPSPPSSAGATEATAGANAGANALLRAQPKCRASFVYPSSPGSCVYGWCQ